MDNQQETNLVWLGAILNAEGYVGVEKMNGGKSLSARASIANTDPAIIVKSRDILQQISVGYYIMEKARTDRSRTLYTIRVDKQAHLKTLLTALMPHLIGEKRARAELVLEYVSRRIERGAPTNRNVEYDGREREIATILEEWFLNDYTRDADNRRRYSLISGAKSESAAETTAPVGDHR